MASESRQFSPEHQAKLREIREAVSLGYEPARGATFEEELRGARGFVDRYCDPGDDPYGAAPGQDPDLIPMFPMT